MQITKQQIEALKAIKNSNLLINLIQKYVQDDPKSAIELLEELGGNMDSLGGIDLSKLETLKGVDGVTPVFGEDYMTGAEIDGLEQFIEDNIDKLGVDLANKLEQSIATAQDKIRIAVGSIKNGVDGKNGKDVTKKDIEEVLEQFKDELRGSPDSPLDVVEKIKKVRGKKRLGIKNVRGLPELKKRVEENTDEIIDIKKEMIKEISIATSNSGGGSGTDENAIHDNVASEISGVELKATPMGADMILIEDSADGNNKKRISVGTLPTGGGGEANTASNVGTGGVGVFKQKNGIDLEFKKINAGSPKITITDNTPNDEVDIDLGVIASADISDFDTEVSNNASVVANTAKETNATHTGDVTGSVGLFIQPIAISGKTAKTVTGAEELLINDAGTIKKTTAQEIADLGGSGSGDMLKSVYDINNSGVVDDSELLNGNNSAYHMDRTNHTGTQLASTISDFDVEVSNNASVSVNTTHKTSNGSDHSFINQDVTTSGSPTFGDLSVSGNAGIGTTNPVNPLQVGDRGVANTVDSQILLSRIVDDSKTGNGHGFSDSSLVTRSGTIGYNSYDAQINVSGSNNFDHFASYQARNIIETSGTTTSSYGYISSLTVNTGTLTNSYGTYIYDPVGTGTIANNYGLYIENQTKGTNNYGLYLGVGNKSFLGGVIVGQWESSSSFNAIGLAGDISDTGYNFLSGTGGGTLYINRKTGGDIRFRENNVDLVTFESGGNVGIGTTSPLYKLDLTGTMRVTGMLTADDGLYINESNSVVGTAGALVRVGNDLKWHDGTSWKTVQVA